MLAEAQSALKASVENFYPNRKFDTDQTHIFNWLRQMVRELNIFIAQYMRLDDVADPRDWRARIERIRQTKIEVGELAQRVQEERQQIETQESLAQQQIEQRAKRQQELFSALKYHVRVIQKDPTGLHDHDWKRVVITTDELIVSGLPPSNVEIRKFLLPVLDLMPEALEETQNFALVLREMDAYLASQEGQVEVPIKPAALTEDVQRVAALLRGRAIVVIGGDRRPHLQQALENAFGLSGLIWIATRSHQSYTVFEPDVARPDVAIVILAIRWASHNFGEVKSLCDAHGKPLVRLPAGYNPNQVATQILKQAGARLAGD